MPTSEKTVERIQSIDVFRALTMLLMIWVNDFWSLSEIPNWLQHQPGDADALGFSDIIFPVFLFIVGLSIPFAIRQRTLKGETLGQSIQHILERSFALLLMGFFMVNLESFNSDAAQFDRSLWQVLMTLAFIMIWNLYPRHLFSPVIIRTIQTTAYLLLAFLAYRFTTGAPDGQYSWMEPHWWGILGLIGWSYFLCSFIQLFGGKQLSIIAVAWGFFALFNIASFAGWLEGLTPVRQYLWIVGSGSIPSLTMAGCFISTAYIQRYENKATSTFPLHLFALGAIVLVVGFLLRPYWGISKIQATPAWTQICTGIGILSYAFFFWLVDLQGQVKWSQWLKPAGVATLTCYLVPYIAYPLLMQIGFTLPDFLLTGALGLAKSFVFAILIVFITAGLNRCGLKLKI